METYLDLKTEAEKLRRSKNYAAALPLYKQLWETHEEKRTDWDGWAYAFCLKQNRQYEQGLEICRVVYAQNRQFEPIRQVYAWCIYYSQIAVEVVQHEVNFLKAATGIVRLSTQEDNFSPYVITVFKVLAYLNNKAIYPYELVLEWTAKLQPALLEEVPFAFTRQDGKAATLASKKEQYYMHFTKALFASGQYDTCITYCTEALTYLKRLHYSNEIWFSRRIALSYKQLGNYKEALLQLKKLFGRKKEWFIQKEIAELYLLTGHHELAIKHALGAALNFGEASKKVSLFELLAELLTLSGHKTEAAKHIAFVYVLRRTNNWRISPELQHLLAQHQLEEEKLPAVFILEKELKQIWINLKQSMQEQLQGTIKTILPNGKAGFVICQNQKSYYFTLASLSPKNQHVATGSRVTFFLEESYDTKKDRITENAVDLRLVA